jgi:hypothetical protein
MQYEMNFGRVAYLCVGNNASRPGVAKDYAAWLQASSNVSFATVDTSTASSTGFTK